jgi:hypothetical protein
MPRVERVRKGLYRIVGLLCRCGGDLFIDKCGSGDFRWETFCMKCKDCDWNGWPTLKDAVSEARGFFNPNNTGPADSGE